MMLQELAEKMKQEEQPEPIAELRRMRAFVKAHPHDEMNQRYAEAAEAEKNIRTAADRYEWLKNMAAINRGGAGRTQRGRRWRCLLRKIQGWH